MRFSPASLNQFAPDPLLISVRLHAETLPGGMAARLCGKMAERGSNDCHDYNDNGVAKPTQSLISSVIMDALRGSVFRCIYTVHQVSSTWKLDRGVEGEGDIMHVWYSQFIWMKMGSGGEGESVCVGWSARICIRVCKPKDEYTNGICAFCLWGELLNRNGRRARLAEIVKNATGLQTPD